MESLLPSEIARLVYGYLITEHCDSAAQLFLETSQHLQECNEAHKKGRKFNVRVQGLALVDILNLYCDAVCMLKNYREKQLISCSEDESNGNEAVISELKSVLFELESVLLTNDNNDQSKQKTVFFRISLPTKKKSSGSDGSPQKMDTEKKETEGKEKEKKKDPPLVEEGFEGAVVAKSVSSSLDDFDLNMLQTLLDNTALHERIAENINKAIDSSGDLDPRKTKGKEIVETVLHSTEADPIFEELLHMLAAPRSEDTTTPEDTDKENGDPTEEIRQPDTNTVSQDHETMKRLEADNNMAIEGILAGNKKAQEQTTVISPQPVCSSQQAFPEAPLIITTPMEGGPITSTPLQPLRATNISTIVGMISPVPGQKMLIPVRSLPRGFPGLARGQARNRRIHPKSDNIPQSVVRIQVQGDALDRPQVIHAVPATSCPEILKKPRARTRGGLQRKGCKGVRSIAPQITQMNDDVNVVFVENKTSVKTRSMSKVAAKVKKDESSLKQRKLGSKLEVISEVTLDTPEKSKSSSNEGLELPISGILCSDKASLNAQIDRSNSQNNCTIVENTVCDTHEEALPTQEKELPLIEDTNGSLPDLNSHNALSKEVQDQAISVQSQPQDVLGAVNKSNNLEILNSEDKPKSHEISTSASTVLQSETDSSILQNEKDVGETSTPEQQALTKVKKRVSLSTPRRGGHIRALDFKTPEKPLDPRKTLTSPKAYTKVNLKNDMNLDKAKREIFNSPEVNLKAANKTPLGCKTVKKFPFSEPKKDVGKKFDWDSDLRKFMDIPTSVGLKRKTTLKKEPKRQPRKKTVRKKTLKENEENVCLKEVTDLNLTPPSNRSSTENISAQIENNLKDANIDEDYSHNPEDNSTLKPTEKYNRSCTSSCSENMVIDEQENDKRSLSIEVEKKSTLETNSLSPGDSCAKIPSAKILESSTCEQHPSEVNPEDISKPGGDLREVCSGTSEDTPTPLKETNSTAKVNDIGQLTPTTKSILNHISSNLSPNSNSQSYTTLESILISEGSRLEKENTFRKTNESIIKITETLSEIDSVTESVKMQPATEKIPRMSEENRRHIPVDCVVKQSLVQTPAKSLTSLVQTSFSLDATPHGKVLPGFPVEMTPLSKVLHSETKILSTSLVTPTLPPTPRIREEKSPENSDCSETENTVKSNSPQNKTHSNKSMSPIGKDNEIIVADPKTGISGVSEINLDKPTPNSDNQIATEVVDLKVPSEGIKKISNQTPRIKLSPKKSKFSKKSKWTPAKRNVRRISSSSSSSDDNTTLGNVSPLASNKKVIGSENLKTKSLIEKGSSRKVLTSTPKPNKGRYDGIQSANKQTKLSPNKKRTQKQFDLSLMKQEEKLIKECLEKTKANAIFGLISSDSDSSDDDINETIQPLKVTLPRQESIKPTLMSAHEKLKKIKSVSNLVSSSSSENVNDDNSLPFKNVNVGISKKDSTSLKIHSKSETIFSEGLLKVASNVNIQSAGIPEKKKIESPKKLDKPLKDIAKVIGREREESCESFPALYLSEESNMSVVSDSYGAKMLKFRKSPSSGSEMLHMKRGAASSTSGSSTLRSNIEKLNNPKQMPVHLKQQILNSPTRNSKDHLTDNGVANSPDNYTTFIHRSPDSAKVASISAQESQAMSRYLDNFIYSFTLDEEESYENSIRTLKTSPFFTIFEMGTNSNQKTIPEKWVNNPDKISHKSLNPPSKKLNKSPVGESPASPSRRERQASPFPPRSDRSKSPLKANRKLSSAKRAERRRNEVPSKSGKGENHSLFREERNKSPILRSERRLSPSPQRDRSRKRHRSHSSSDDDRRKYSRYEGYEGSMRRGYRNNRSLFRRNKFRNIRSQFYSSPRYGNNSRFHERHERFHVSRIDLSDNIKRPHKRSSNEFGDQSPHLNKSSSFEKRFNLNDTFRSSKSSESDRLMVDQSFRSSDYPDSSHETKSNQRLHHNNISENYLKKKSADLEEGELSDVSDFHPNMMFSSDATREAKRKELIALMSDDSRAQLLNSVDLDRFLTMLHGAEKEDN